MNKQNFWFITLFSLIIILSIYYVTMPNDLLLSTGDEFDEEKVSVTISEGELISALRITKEEERVAKEEDYQAVLTSSDSTTALNIPPESPRAVPLDVLDELGFFS